VLSNFILIKIYKAINDPHGDARKDQKTHAEKFVAKIKYSQFKKMAVIANHLNHCRRVLNSMASNLVAAFFQTSKDSPIHLSNTRHTLHPNKIPILTTNNGL
jgi:hypothetical protein